MRETPYDAEFFGKIEAGAIRSARAMLPVVLELIPPRGSVVDFGCGTGAWLSVAKQLGIQRLLGLDFAQDASKKFLLDKDEFLAVDLQQPVRVGNFDLCISLEVAEHLSPEAEEVFVQSLCNSSSVVLFSAAVPDQGGDGHVNERWLNHWFSLFQTEGYDCFDVVRPKIWNLGSIEWWYRQNSFLAVKREENAICERLFSQVTFHGNNIVHPEMLAQRMRRLRYDAEMRVRC